MANTAKFDRREVLESATRLFWQKGYHGTSTRDIQQATNLKPGSIYAAFGSKSGLFNEVLHFYAESMADQLAQILSEHHRVTDGLRAFLRHVILEGGDDAPSELCLLAKSLSELEEGEAELLSETRKLLAATEQRFQQALSQAVANAELPANTDTALAARQLQIQLIGLRSYLRATGNRGAVEELIARQFFS
ncbi:TetR/AcrR family transcriptional regulator [Microbulbifer sp. HZ11]|uniref:TetR/AcrR family transcriptional regulator n=1 Tax=unclassified Microbulbifer TaxID=2619833 RepID=UPI0005B8F9BF|nr:TetR/AcrR family transcriptional regulator [Microbulbifer sp. HZ11]